VIGLGESKIRVLLADDHPIVRSGMCQLLARADDIMIVGETGRGDEALSLVNSLNPDVLVLDMEMPGKTGAEVARELQAAGSPVRVLVLSAYDDEAYIMGLLENGAAGYLTKDEALDHLVDAVRGVAHGEEGWYSRRAAARIASAVRRQPTDPVALTEREQEVLNLAAEGWTNRRIAQELFISERTVRFHLTHAYDKLGVSNRAEAIHWVLVRRPE
jgi:DNA-binding NarL/FixJ family response regulator